jgi:TRAP-type C4-dicarboxylate transport system permease large subunit
MIAGVSLGQVSRAALPLILSAFVALLIACFWPPLTLWIPSLIYP